MVHSNDQRLSALIEKGQSGDIVIMGSPFDYARKRCIHKGGQDLGPCCLRRFYHKVGPIYNVEYGIDLSGLKVSDYGNIRPAESQDTAEQIIKTIQQQINTILSKDKLPFVFGGSKECSLGAIRAFHNLYPLGKTVIIAGKPFLKKAYDGDKLSSDNLMTLLATQFPQHQILLGPSQSRYPKGNPHCFEYISLEQIRALKIKPNMMMRTQGVWALNELLIRQADIPLHITLSLQAIQAFRGCRDMVPFGLQMDQMLQIFYLLGCSKQVKSIDITQFNPSCEDYQSSLFILTLFYYFLMGRTKII